MAANGIRRFFLVTAAVATACGPAAVHAGAVYAECVEARKAIADTHRSRSDEILLEHDRELNSIVGKFVAKSSPDAKTLAYIDRSKQSILKYHQVEVAKEQLVDDVIDQLLSPKGADDEDFRCPDENATSDWARRSSGRLERVLEDARADFEERIDFESLEEDEGLAIIAFYAHGDVSSARINRLGSLTGSIELELPGRGEHVRLLKLPAGDYEWQRVRQEAWFNKYFFELGHRDQRFSVLPGKLNITGVFIYESTGRYASTSLNDRPAIVLRLIEQRFPELLDRFDLANGMVPEDRFIDVYLAEKRAIAEERTIVIEVADDSVPTADEGEQADESGPSFDDLYRIGQIKNAVLSPSTRYTAYARGNVIMVGNTELGFHEIYKFGSLRLIKLQWSGENVLLGSFRGRSRGTPTLHVMEIGLVDGKLEETRHEYHQVNGYVFDPLTDRDEEIIFAQYKDRGDHIAADLFRFRLFDKPFPQFKLKRRLNKGIDNLSWYLRSPSGEFVAGVSYREEGLELWSKPEGTRKWQKLWTAPAESTFVPVGISRNMQQLWALSNVTTDRVAAVEFSLAEATIASVIYEHDRFDLDDIVLSDESGDPLAVSYLEQGINRYHFFSDESREIYEAARAMFPDEGVILTGFSQVENVQLVIVTSPQNPGTVYRCDLDIPDCQVVEHTRPWLADVVLAQTRALEVESTDGLTIDAFLTLPPAATGSIPLLVMPHGGPIGVSDNRYYSGDVQWLAMNGYAVLQVNYRGSAGYGKTFLKSGLGEWGRGIEDDIEAAVALVLERYPSIDAGRIGAIGSSYGGYSALMSILRNPDLFRCAVSFAGVTDLTLLFNGERVRKNADLRDLLVDMIGDPAVEYDQLVEYSPVYQFRRFTRPLLLAHGTDDSVVDIEHSWRLKIMLDLAGIDAEFVVLDRVGHGFPYVSQAKKFYDPAIAFLDTHLKDVDESSSPDQARRISPGQDSTARAAAKSAASAPSSRAP